MIQEKKIWANGFIFATLMWLLSRLVIAAAMLLLAPALPAPSEGIAPTFGWGVFSWWDSIHYQSIATSGYEYANDGKGHTVAFFPLFPLLIRAGMSLGLPSEVAGTLVNNFAFLGALIVLYYWVEESHGKSAARWATAVLAWCPFSLFGTVIYTEGLFLLCSTSAMRAFDKHQYAQTAFWGALATASRLPGAALIPAFLVVAWKEGRAAIAYIASLAAGAGLLLYILYCQIRFGEPLAFLIVQKAWIPPQPFHGWDWFRLMKQIIIGPANFHYGKIVDPWYPLLLVLICGCGFALWLKRKKLGDVNAGYGVCALVVFLWLLGGAPLINGVMVFGGGYLLWYSRTKLKPVAVTYGFFTLALILSTGRTMSVERFVYGCSVMAIALGLLLSRYPRWGYATMGFFAILLASLAVRFSQHLWAG